MKKILYLLCFVCFIEANAQQDALPKKISVISKNKIAQTTQLSVHNKTLCDSWNFNTYKEAVDYYQSIPGISVFSPSWGNGFFKVEIADNKIHDYLILYFGFTEEELINQNF